MKFGGSILDSSSKIKTLVKIVHSFKNLEGKDNEIVCVISAISGITDKIIMLSELIIKGKKSAIKTFIDEMTSLHLDLIENTIPDQKLQAEAKNVILDIMKEFQAILEGLVLIPEITPRSLDHMLSFGERLVAPIVSYSLRNNNMDSDFLTGKEVGIVTDSNFGEARPLILRQDSE